MPRAVKSMSQKTEHMLRDLLVTALEGGSNYWYMLEDKVLPPGVTLEDVRSGGRLNPDKKDYWNSAYIIPFLVGVALIIGEIEPDAFPKGKKFRLDLTSMRKGFRLMRQKYPKMFYEVLNESYDANHADVWLQLCLFGEVIFG